jgi:archaellum biogenesis protein FlaJ (TadC family)
MSGILKEFQKTYGQSGLDRSFEDYTRIGVLALGATYAASFVLILMVHMLLLGVVGLQLVVASLSLSLVPTGVAAFAIIYYPYHLREQAKKRLENNLIYTTSYMTILATSGLSIERIMENITETEVKGPLKKLGVKFMADIRLLGLDLDAALQDIIDRSPSPQFASLISGIRNVQKTSGDMKSVLNFNYVRYLQEKRKELAKMLNTLTYLGEGYVTLMVVAPIMFIFMLTVFSIITTTGDAVSSALQLNILVFFAMPLFAAAFIIVLDTILGVED